MNTLIWGTCNTNLGVNQCQANMEWFIQSLKQECQADLTDKNELAVDALTGELESLSLTNTHSLSEQQP